MSSGNFRFDKMNCPLCNSKHLASVASFESNRIAEAWMEQYKADISTIFQSFSKIELIKCTHCHLQFFSPAPSAPAIYNRLLTFDWYYMEAKWEYNRAMTDLDDCSHILEIGVGQAILCSKLVQRSNPKLRG